MSGRVDAGYPAWLKAAAVAALVLIAAGLVLGILARWFPALLPWGGLLPAGLTVFWIVGIVARRMTSPFPRVGRTR